MTVPAGLISPDDHVMEPADLWDKRLPSRYRDIGPRVVRERGVGHLDQGVYTFTTEPDGRPADLWLYEDEIIAVPMTAAAAGYDLDDLSIEPITYDDMRPGCFQQGARLEDMDVAGIGAQACFPNMFVRFCGQRFLFAEDKELAKLCVEAYNDFQIDEWCAGSNGRLIPLGIVPLWDVELAAREVYRVANRGMHALCFSELPPFLGLPSIYSGYWDPFFAACESSDTAIMMHIGSSSKLPVTSADCPPVVTSTLTGVNSAMSMMDWLFSGVLVRFPLLRIAFAECQAGWVPYFVQRADEVWENRRAWGGINPLLTDPPSSYVPGHIWYSTFSDRVAFKNIDLIGADSIMFETDYPHNDTNWPSSSEVAAEATSMLTPELREKVLRGNACRLFNLT